jgi:hypothetical protein
MKTRSRLLNTFLLMTLLLAIAPGAIAQVNGLTNSGDMTVCLNSTQPYGVIATPGSTYTWIILPGSGGAGTIIPGSAPNNLISVNWTGPGTCTLQVTETTALCTGDPVNITVTVLPGLIPGTCTASQTICYNSVPEAITATAPTGGNGISTYQWEYSTDGGSTWQILAGATDLAYSPGALTVTTAYHLVQTAEMGCGSVTTNDVIVTVQPLIVTSPIFHE